MESCVRAVEIGKVVKTNIETVKNYRMKADIQRIQGIYREYRGYTEFRHKEIKKEKEVDEDIKIKKEMKIDRWMD